jgi:hypothetical protein
MKAITCWISCERPWSVLPRCASFRVRILYFHFLKFDIVSHDAQSREPNSRHSFLNKGRACRDFMLNPRYPHIIVSSLAKAPGTLRCVLPTEAPVPPDAHTTNFIFALG